MYGSVGSIIVELAVVALLVIGIVSGVKKGLFKTLMDLLILAAAIFAAVQACRFATDYFVNRLYPKAEARVLQAIENSDVDLANVDLSAMKFDESHPDTLNEAEYELLRHNEGIGKIINAMEKAGIPKARIWKIVAVTLKKASAGGSNLKEALTDTAKAATVLLSGYEGKTEDYVLAVPLKLETSVPVFLVPTTTGTGSEVTRVAIISRPEFNKKWSVHLRHTTLAIVDPSLTVTLPRKETANTGLDALAHATEALTSKGAEIHSDLFAVAAIEKITQNLYRSWSEPEDREARTNMAVAANLAGLAFDCPMCHLPHAIGDAFGCHFHTEHGHSCSLGLPEGLRLVAPVVPDKMAIVAKAMGIELSGTETGEQLGDLVADWIYALMRKMEFVSLHSMGITREQVLACAEDVATSHLVGYCPVTITKEVAEDVLGRLYDNYQ